MGVARGWLRAWWTRVLGAARLVRMLVKGGDLSASYAFLEHMRRTMFEPEVGMQRAILQGVWDRYPREPATLRELELLVDHDPPRPGDRVLDLGCGEGVLVELLARRYPEVGSVTAVDALQVHLDRVRALLEELPAAFREKVRLVQGLAQELPPGGLGADLDKAYLVELSQDMLTAEFERVFEAVFRAVKPGGLIAMAVMAVNRKPNGFLESIIFDTGVRPGSPSRQELHQLFARLPCDVLEVDVTRTGSYAALSYLLAHPALVAGALLWPFNHLFNLSLKAGLGVMDADGYSMRMIYVRKWED